MSPTGALANLDSTPRKPQAPRGQSVGRGRPCTRKTPGPRHLWGHVRAVQKSAKVKIKCFSFLKITDYVLNTTHKYLLQNWG